MDRAFNHPMGPEFLPKKEICAQFLWALSNLPALRYTIDQCLIPMGFILHSKRVIKNIEVNAQLIILEDGHSHGHTYHTHTQFISKIVSMYCLRVNFTWHFKLITKVFRDMS